MGAEIDVIVDVGYPVVNNDEKLYPVARKEGGGICRKENVQETEQYAWALKISDTIPRKFRVAFYRLGVMNAAKGIISRCSYTSLLTLMNLP